MTPKLYLFWFINILSIVILVFYLRWLGIKGLVGFMTGMAIMAFLMMTKNPMLTFVLSKTGHTQSMEWWKE